MQTRFLAYCVDLLICQLLRGGLKGTCAYSRLLGALDQVGMAGLSAVGNCIPSCGQARLASSLRRLTKFQASCRFVAGTAVQTVVGGSGAVGRR